MPAQVLLDQGFRKLKPGEALGADSSFFFVVLAGSVRAPAARGEPSPGLDGGVATSDELFCTYKFTKASLNLAWLQAD